MLICILLCAVCAGGGFGLGRIKNASKLKKIDDVIGNIGRYATAETRMLAATIRDHL